MVSATMDAGYAAATWTDTTPADSAHNNGQPDGQPSPAGPLPCTENGLNPTFQSAAAQVPLQHRY